MGCVILPCDVGEVSDGYHTFNELYDHRQLLFVSLVNSHPDISWKSRFHDDGTSLGGNWFIAGMHLSSGDITYHLQSKYWNILQVEILDRAPPWDGHTSKDVLDRLIAINS